MIGVSAHSIADDLRQNLGAATAGKFQLLENQDSRSLANDETVARRIPGPAGLFRLVVARGESAHGREPADTHWSDCGFRSAGDHHLRIAAGNDFEGVTDRVRT